jgi:hypothetical protein
MNAPLTPGGQPMDPLAAALAGGGDPNAPALAPGIVDALNQPQLDQSSMLAMALSQPPPMPVAMADFSMPDFNFGGMFNG